MAPSRTRSFRCLTITLLLGWSLIKTAIPVAAQSLFPSGSGFIEDTVFDNLPISTAVAFGPGGRVFIANKDGIVRIARNGVLQATPFIDITAITNRRTDRGIGGIAVDPQFPTRPYLYIFFTYDPPGLPQDTELPRASRLIRVEADPTRDFNVAKGTPPLVLLGTNSQPPYLASQLGSGSSILPEPASCMTELTMEGTPIHDCLPSDELSHSAGDLAFAADGMLYASHGDGSSYRTASKPALRSQNLDSLAGKILRINPDTGAGVSDNPFFEPSDPHSNRSKVWALGQRNPFRIAINPANGQVYSGDVGSSSYEEINVGKGANFGWPCFEGGNIEANPIGSGNTISQPSPGYQSFSRTRSFCRTLGLAILTPPRFSYRHPLDAGGQDLGAAVTGVAFYSGSSYPSVYRSSVFIADFARRHIRRLEFNQSGVPTPVPFADESSAGGPVQLVIGPDSNLWALYLDYTTRKSQLRRFRYTGSANTPPTVIVRGTPTAGSIPLNVSFSTVGTFDPDGQDLGYRWDFGDGSGNTSTLANPSYTYTSVGTFEATVTVRELSAPFAEASASVTIRTGVTPPRVTIQEPAIGKRYRIGETISFAGSAVFAGRAVPTASLSWSVMQEHNLHEHLINQVDGVSSGTFSAAEHSDNTRYLVCLLATGEPGVVDQGCVRIEPETVTVSLASEPPGASITYVDEGQEIIAPAIVRPILGSSQTIIAAPVHDHRSFARWSDGVTTPERDWIVNSTNSAFTAVYENLRPTARIQISPAAITVGSVVTFSGTQSSDPENSALTFIWDFGNGDLVEGASVQRAFATPGVFPVSLAVFDPLGESDVQSVNLTVSESTAANQPPSVSAGLPITASLGTIVSMRGFIADDGKPFGTVTSLWTRIRGDKGMIVTSPGSPTSTATFPSVGTYLLKLEATDGSLRASQNTAVTINPPSPGFSVTSLSLINANTGAVIPGYETISNGAVIVIPSLPTTALNVRANLSGSGAQSVTFLSDAQPLSVDNSEPFAIQPTADSRWVPWPYSTKRYLITAIPFSGANGSGTPGGAVTIQFTFRNSPLAGPTNTPTVAPTATPTAAPTTVPTTTVTPSPTPTAQANNRAPIISTGLAINTTFGTPVTLPGHVTDDGLPITASLAVLWSRIRGPGTVSFSPATSANTSATFSAVGTYLLKLEATDSALRTSLNGLVTVNPVDPPFTVTSLSLINADTGAVVPGYESIQNGSVIQIGSLPRLNLRANVSGGAVGSVVWLSDATSLSVDSSEPFAIAPSAGVTYSAWGVTSRLYRLTAVPYAGANGTGTAGAAISVQFSFRQ